MKTIAITIDDSTLGRLDRAARGDGGPRRRSRLVRRAVVEFLDRQGRIREESEEAVVVRRHAAKLRRQAAALIRDQAKP